MRFTLISCLLPLVTLAIAQDTNLSTVKKAFEAAKIPGDLGIIFNPTVLLDVTFPQKAKASVTLHVGLHVPLNDTAIAPVFSVTGTKCKGPFVVAMIDPDAPTPVDRSLGQVRHFLGGGFTPKTIGHSPTALLTNSTPAVSDFYPPGPPAGSAAHRYTFLLFEQSAGFTTQSLINGSTSIVKFNISEFAAATGLGSPIGGTYMLVAPNN